MYSYLSVSMIIQKVVDEFLEIFGKADQILDVISIRIRIQVHAAPLDHVQQQANYLNDVMSGARCYAIFPGGLRDVTRRASTLIAIKSHNVTFIYAKD